MEEAQKSVCLVFFLLNNIKIEFPGFEYVILEDQMCHVLLGANRKRKVSIILDEQNS